VDIGGNEDFTSLREFHIKASQHHEQLRPLALPFSSSPVTHSQTFTLSTRMVSPLCSYSSPYSPRPTLPSSTLLTLALTLSFNSITYQDSLQEVQNLREQIYRVKGTTVRTPDAYFHMPANTCSDAVGCFCALSFTACPDCHRWHKV
jgi:hypothetical protein